MYKETIELNVCQLDDNQYSIIINDQYGLPNGLDLMSIAGIKNIDLFDNIFKKAGGKLQYYRCYDVTANKECEEVTIETFKDFAKNWTEHGNLKNQNEISKDYNDDREEYKDNAIYIYNVFPKAELASEMIDMLYQFMETNKTPFCQKAL